MTRITVRLPDSSATTVEEMVEDVQQHTGYPPVRGTVDEGHNIYRIEVEDGEVSKLRRHIRSLGFEVTR